MNNISCDVCQDLIPLVKDGVASEDSINLVKKHIIDCPSCKELYSCEIDINFENSKAITKKIKKQLIFILIVIMLIGTLLGIGITNSAGVFYNVIVMPVIGAIGYIALKKRSYVVPVTIFILSTISLTIISMIQGELVYSTITELVSMSCFWSLIYAGLSAVGIIIAALLSYAFGKEKKIEN